ncbi:Pr6Pr family membrane protein [Lactobacillus terrae]|uniref:Pr6Pr family membrane protein n=1 Tax=Lactobacillus terrae TaxID=2269374 RepID=UPI000C1B65D8|nr:Pr6Pr family membrane protein [Lactobacillus terrae]
MKTKYYYLTISILSFIGIFKATYIGNLDFRYTNLYYYTDLSNLLVLFFYLYSFWKLNSGDIHSYSLNYSNIKFSMTTFITLTGIVYWLLLAPDTLKTEGISSILTLDNLLLHLIIPIMVLFDWFLSREKIQYNKKTIYIPILITFIYLILTEIRVFYGIRISKELLYPYFFLDPSMNTVLTILVYILVIAILLLLIGYLLLRTTSKKIKEQ